MGAKLHVSALSVCPQSSCKIIQEMKAGRKNSIIKTKRLVDISDALTEAINKTNQHTIWEGEMEASLADVKSHFSYSIYQRLKLEIHHFVKTQSSNNRHLYPSRIQTHTRTHKFRPHHQPKRTRGVISEGSGSDIPNSSWSK